MPIQPIDHDAVQTLRNLTMAASFLASTTILVALGLLSYSLTSESLQTFTHTLNRLGSSHPELVLYKFLFLICVFLYVFFNYTLAIRYYNHAAFILNIPSEHLDDSQVQRVGRVVNRGALHYTSGSGGHIGFPSLLLGFNISGLEWIQSLQLTSIRHSPIHTFG